MANLRSGLKLNSSTTVTGKVSISQKALEKVLELTAGTVKDVNDMTKTFQTIFGTKIPEVRFVNSASLKLVDNQLVADIFININYGVNVVQTSYRVQSDVINHFKEMLDLELSRVNVHVLNLIDEKNSVDEV